MEKCENFESLPSRKSSSPYFETFFYAWPIVLASLLHVGTVYWQLWKNCTVCKVITQILTNLLQKCCEFFQNVAKLLPSFVYSREKFHYIFYFLERLSLIEAWIEKTQERALHLQDVWVWKLVSEKRLGKKAVFPYFSFYLTSTKFMSHLIKC